MSQVVVAVSPDKSELVQDNLKHAIRMLDDAASSAKSGGWQMVFLNTATAVQTLGMMFQNLGLTEVASKLTEASHKIPKSVPRSLKGTLMSNARWNIYSHTASAPKWDKSKTKRWMKSEVEHHVDRKTDEVNTTSLAESAANEFNIYENTRDYKIPDDLFDLAVDVGKDWERANKHSSEEARRSRFEEGKPADPTQNMDPADSKKWKEMHDEHKDNFKSAALDKELLERYQLEVDTAIASLKLARKNPKNPKRYFFSALHSMSTALGQLEPENGPWPASEAVMHAAEKINMLRPVTDFAK
jgi:hypothetical protein